MTRKTLVPFMILAAALPSATAPPPSLAQPAWNQPAQARPAARVDPRAAQALAQMAAAYRGLRSFSATLDSATERKDKPPLPFLHARIAFQRPSQACVLTAVRTARPTQAVTDGAVTTATWIVDGQERYFQRPAIRGCDVTNTLLQGVGPYLMFPAQALDGMNPLPYLKTRSLVSLAVGRPRTAGGVPVVVVVARYRHAPTSEEDVAFLIGRDDHLLRRVEDAWTGAAGRRP